MYIEGERKNVVKSGTGSKRSYKCTGNDMLIACC